MDTVRSFLNVVCAVCKRRIGYRPCEPEHAGKSSHGYCRPCWESLGYPVTPDLVIHWQELEASLKESEGEGHGD